MNTAYNIIFKEKITNEFFLKQLQNKVATIFGGLKFWGMRKVEGFNDQIWHIVTPSVATTTDSIWRIGLDAPSPADQYEMRSHISVFDVRPMKTGFKYHFSSPGPYWRLYALRRVLDSMAIELGAETIELGINSSYTKKIEPQEYKNYLDFLKKTCPKKLKSVRGFYLKELKEIPQEILDAESGFKNFI